MPERGEEVPAGEDGGPGHGRARRRREGRASGPAVGAAAAVGGSDGEVGDGGLEARHRRTSRRTRAAAWDAGGGGAGTRAVFAHTIVIE